ncbi:YihY/virulence factor BrkB family protein [Microbacterium sp. G2-8]|uniref:YihY/virulence factor BrkB family protein n=1 Tax=Microbacterium sp. G2-8 TaxID=2842454 RepID=UPI001C89CBCE|nr:YihY/virulence factor BrkB family protein [Microbacterium sp. G2-8]
MAKVLSGVKAALAWLLQLRFTRAVLMFGDHRGGLLAAAITFRALFAVFAAVLLGFSLASLVLSSNSELWQSLITSVDRLVPGLVATDGTALINVDEVPEVGTGVTIAGIVSVLALVLALVSAVGNLRVSVRILAGTRQNNSNAIVMRLKDLLFALSIGVLLLVSAVVTFLGSSFVDTALVWLGIRDGGVAVVLTRVVAVLVTFLIDAIIIAWLFWLQAGLSVHARDVVPGALIGGAGLVVLQQLSSLFVGGADNNPLLAGFASLIALLLWFNLSAQVILVACAFIVVTAEERHNRVGERYGAETLGQRAVRAAERDMRVAEDALLAAREAEKREREQIAALEERFEDDESDSDTRMR